jgi:hypothetical protein
MSGLDGLYTDGFAPSRIPPCGGALVLAACADVAVLLTAEVKDDMAKVPNECGEADEVCEGVFMLYAWGKQLSCRAHGGW